MTSTALISTIGQFTAAQRDGNYKRLVRSIGQATTEETLNKLSARVDRHYLAGSIAASHLAALDAKVTAARIRLENAKEDKNMKPVTPEEIEEFCVKVMDLREADMKKNYPGSYQAGRDGRDISFSIGKRYARIIAEGSSCWAFIDMENGDILKAESWAKPAKHARGNIRNGIRDVGPNGPGYLR